MMMRFRLRGVRWVSTCIVGGKWRTQGRADRVAVREMFSKRETIYSELLRLSLSATEMIQQRIVSYAPQNVVLACRPSIEYCIARWAIWGASAAVVPADPLHSTPQITYIIRDSQSALVITDHDHVRKIAEALHRPVLHPQHLLQYQRDIEEPTDHVNENDTAMIMYTAREPGRPKGVVISHGLLENRIASLTKAWEYSDEFNVLHCLPLEYIYGATNALDAVLWNRGTVSLMQDVDATTIWQHICEDDRLNVLMVTANMYCRLIVVFRKMNEEKRAQCMEACRRFKLMVSGGPTLPESVINRWKEISGHVILERHYLTQVGDVLANPLHGERRIGYFGKASPNVELKLEPEEEEHDEEDAVECGELRVKGPTVFSSFLKEILAHLRSDNRYWNLPIATTVAFDEAGWFKTGDVAVKDASGYYKIIGKSKSGLISTDGHMVSAIELRQLLMKHPDIADCVVFGVPDQLYENAIAVAVVAQKVNATTTDCEMELGLRSVRKYLATDCCLQYYKLPRHMLMLDELPRDSTGRVRIESLVRSCLEQLK